MDAMQNANFHGQPQFYIPEETIKLIETEQGGLQKEYLDDLAILADAPFKDKYKITKDEAITAYRLNFWREFDKLSA